MKTFIQDFGEGAWQRTPPLFTALGMCPALAVTTAAQYGFVMGISTAFVLVVSSALISTFRHLIPREVRIPVFTITVATMVTVADLVLAGFMPAVHRILGIYIPLIMVNCIIFGRIESFASQHTPFRAISDALGYGLGFTWALTLIGGVREILAAGTFFGLQVMPTGFTPWIIMQTPPGAFITMGLLVGIISAIRNAINKDSVAETEQTTRLGVTVPPTEKTISS